MYRLYGSIFKPRRFLCSIAFLALDVISKRSCGVKKSAIVNAFLNEIILILIFHGKQHIRITLRPITT